MSGAIQHRSDCAIHNEPAFPAGPCDCGGVTLVTDADEREGYPDCQFCHGWGFYRAVASERYCEGEKVGCGNCIERRRWEGLEREPQRSWCVWTKTGRRPAFWHNTQDAAETEAARLARKCPGKTFIVFQKVVNIRAAQVEGDAPETPEDTST